MRREKYAKNKVTGSRIYYFNGVRHGVRNDRKYVIIRICQQLYFSDTLFS